VFLTPRFIGLRLFAVRHFINERRVFVSGILALGEIWVFLRYTRMQRELHDAVVAVRQLPSH